MGTWTSTALAAALHAAVLVVGSQAASAAPEQDGGVAIEEIRRYLAASEQRAGAVDKVALESQQRENNRMVEGRHGTRNGGDEEGPPGGTEKKAAGGDLSLAGSGKGGGNKGQGVGRLAPKRIPYGKLPAEVIQRIVRQNFGRFRLCAEQAMLRSWGLMGRVTVRFVIDRSGSVSSALVTHSDMPDRQITGCVAKAFKSLRFPEPKGGVVVVSYPILFEPGG
jgi:hypothetical protein